ncbi:methionine ABC transporter ATP-binding protein [Curtobacterium sp. BRB10]|uniref:methionine ABC transporter ATP-binding protein n=1 Tax=Curtobacterium sp. BRB10 TaxID=2962579 RepID=UPI0028822E68|nr:methionine ABC transporter ATP-binding protein [Curtobacterium sp. BRB10]MDT0234808.1 methionine ABC transporter ATP-binding protein [Curtobacterium sp. BRB10]
MSDVFRLEGVSKTYGNGERATVALDNLTLSIPRGSFAGIVGQSGAGKSTLLRLFNLLEQPDRGRILFDGQEIQDLRGAARRDYLSRVPTVFQHFNLFHSKTVLENVAFPLAVRGVPRDRRTARARELLDLVGLAGKERSYPSQLSGGQKQRVGIARALVADAEVLLCDEATSALDSATTAVILDLLLDLRERLDLTIVLITHSWSVVRYSCDTATLVEGGRVVESGGVRALLQDPDSYLGRQLLPAPDHGGGPADGWARYDVLLPDVVEQGDFFSVVADRLGVGSRVVSGGVEQLGGVAAGRFLVDFDLREGQPELREELSSTLRRRGIVVGAVA